MINDEAFSDYYEFEKELMHQNRFFIDPKFAKSLKEIISLNLNKLYKGTVLYRARRHEFGDSKDRPFVGKDMYNPRPEKAIRGRANPDGISYLYLSSDIETCLKELELQNVAFVTVGEFTIKNDLNIIDLTQSFPVHTNNYLTSLNHCIRLTFSKTISTARPEIEYLPYQYICEFVKNEKLMGSCIKVLTTMR